MYHKPASSTFDPGVGNRMALWAPRNIRSVSTCFAKQEFFSKREMFAFLAELPFIDGLVRRRALVYRWKITG